MFNNVELLIHNSDLGGDLCKSEKIIWSSDELSQKKVQGNFTSICVNVNNKIEKYVLPFDLTKYVLNCIHCIHLMRYLGFQKRIFRRA